MKVLHLEAGRHLYGGARQVAHLLDGLREHPVDSVLLCPQGSAIAAAVGPDTAHVHTLALGGDADIGAIRRLRRIMRDEAPDIIHLHSRRGADTLGALAALGLGAKVVLSRRVDNPESKLALLLKYRLCDRVITVSEAISDVLRAQGVDAQKLVCVHDAVQVSDWTAPASRAQLQEEFSLRGDAPVVGMAAQFIRRKGHDVLLDALPQVIEEHPSLQVILFGKGRHQERIQRRVADEGLTHNVLFAGFRDDLPRWLGALDMVVHPASAEGLGVALLQGAAASVPLVACDAGGIGEIVIDGRTGRLVPPRAPSALAQAMLETLNDRDGAARRAAAARDHLRTHFSIPAMTQGTLGVYRDLLESHA